MRSFLKHLICGVTLLLATSLLAPAKGDKDADKAKSAEKKKDPDKKKKEGDKKDGEKKKEKKKKPGDESAPPEEADSGRLNLPLVKEHDSLGLKIPYTDVNGKLQMIYYIGVATRLDDDNVRMKETKVETYNDEGEVEMTVDLPVSNLNLATKVVSSNTETTIKREDFIITGDSVRFNTVTKEAALVGHVRMVVYDLNDEAGKPPTTPPASE